MILIGNQRGGSKDLALHLLKAENERVEVHQVRGFASDHLIEALQESYAMSRGTRCKQHLFSVSLNPPKDAAVENEVFEDAIERIEERLGLDGQPRAIVFHEKNGRRHAHAVWCRIDSEKMKAVQLSQTHNKLQTIAREIYIERDWRMPKGFVDKEFRDPHNFTLAEWQQSKRAEKDPKAMKSLFQDAWAISDGRTAFQHALNERGFVLAKGDRRGAVAVDHTGEAYAVSRWVGVKAKQVSARLGELDALPSVSDAHVEAAKMVTTRLAKLKAEQEKTVAAQKMIAAIQLGNIAERQKIDVKNLDETQKKRTSREEKARQARLRKGLPGFWDRLTGRRKQVLSENREATVSALRRDKAELKSQEARQASEKISVLKGAARSRLAHKAVSKEISNDIYKIDRDTQQAEKIPRPTPQKVDPDKKSNRQKRSRDGPRRSR